MHPPSQLTGLAPGVAYHYRVRSSGPGGEVVESAEYQLQAAPTEDTPFSFAVASETGGHGDVEIDRRVSARSGGSVPISC